MLRARLRPARLQHRSSRGAATIAQQRRHPSTNTLCRPLERIAMLYPAAAPAEHSIALHLTLPFQSGPNRIHRLITLLSPQRLMFAMAIPTLLLSSASTNQRHTIWPAWRQLNHVCTMQSSGVPLHWTEAPPCHQRR